MRQIFTSQRIETVEGVAKLLNDAGIETYISNARSYQGKRGSQFSYTQPVPEKQRPALWVRHADDQPRAREILREAGLLDTTRPDQRRPLLFTPLPGDEKPRRSWAWRIRLLLLAAIAAVALFIYLRPRPPAVPPPAAPQQQAPPTQDPGIGEDEVRIRIPTPSPPPPDKP